MFIYLTTDGGVRYLLIYVPTLLTVSKLWAQGARRRIGKVLQEAWKGLDAYCNLCNA